MTTLISKTTPPFFHEWQMVRVSSRHLIGRASISIIIIQSIIVITIIISLILIIRSHGRRWWRDSLRSKSAHGHLPSSYAANMDIHLIQLCWKCIEASIHALKLRHDVSQRHIARRRRGSRCGSSRMRWSRTGGRCRILLLRPKLASLSFTVAASMAHIKMKGSDAGEGTEKWHKILVIAEGKMSLPQDNESWKTSIKDKIKWKGKSMVRCSRRDNKKRAWDSVMEL